MSQTYSNADAPVEGEFAVYFSGVYIPAISVSISSGGWSLPQAFIQVPASPLLLRFGNADRVQVAIFYKDQYYKWDTGEAEYRLIFDGEITSFSQILSAGGVTQSFTAVSHLQLFAEMFVDFVSGTNDIANTLNSVGGSVGQGTYGATFPALFFKRALDPTGPSIKRPWEFIKNVLQALANDGIVGTTNAAKDSESGIEANAASFMRSTAALKFFNRHRRFVKLAKRFVACPIVEDRLENGESSIFPIIEAVGNQAIVRSLIQHSMGFANKSSVWQIIYTIFKMMFYDMLFLNAAPFVMSDFNGNIVGKGSTNMPRVNDDHLLKQLPIGESKARLLDSDGNSYGIYVDPNYELVNVPLYDPTLVDSLDYSGFVYPIWDGTEYRQAFPQLGQYITCPENLFGIPPKCNLIFPSMASSISYSENYATQPTRLYMADDEWLNHGVPNSEGLYSSADNALRAGYPREVNSRLQRFRNQDATRESIYDQLLWPDEYFRGVIMSREPAPGWLWYLAQQEDQVNQANGDLSADADAAAAVPDGDISEDTYRTEDGTPLDPVTRMYTVYSKYKFFTEKYSRRSGTVVLDFNPYIVPGQPMLFIDDSEFGTSLLAYVSSVNWVLSNGQMSTSVSFTHGRTVYENEQLLRDTFFDKDPDLASGHASLTQPDNPVWSLVGPLHEYAQANELFGRMFYPGESGGNYCAPYQYYMNRVVDDATGTRLDIALDGTTIPTVEFPLKLKEEFAPMVKSARKALEHVARPICTLQEYIHFIDGINPETEFVQFDEHQPKKPMFIKHYTPVNLADIAENAKNASETSVVVKRCSIDPEAEVSADHEILLRKYHDFVLNNKTPLS